MLTGLALILFFIGISLQVLALSSALLTQLKFNKANHIIKASTEINPISIIICAHNEAENLKSNLPIILQQKLTEFEVIVVNDHSTDQTQPILEALQLKYPQLNVISLQNQTPRKRNALLAGVNAAKFDRLLFTDADCYPQSESWAKLMCGSLSATKQLVLGVSPYVVKNTWLNTIIQLETSQTAIQYLSFAQLNQAYMGVGRNLAVLKSAFLKYHQYELDKNLESGDDDMLVQRFPASRITTQSNPKAFTLSQAKLTWRDWIQQKKRHYTTARFYNKYQLLALGLVGISRILFWCGIIVFMFSSFWLFALSIGFLMWLLNVIVFKVYKNIIQTKKLYWFWPALELNLLIFQLYIYLLNFINPSKSW